jgi:hypothetical protein
MTSGKKPRPQHDGTVLSIALIASPVPHRDIADQRLKFQRIGD